MKFDPRKHHRRSIRLKGYDYSHPGAYFVTACTHQRKCLLGEIVGGEMVLDQLGEIVQHAWNDLPQHYPHVILDEFCIMPNHFHGILFLTESSQGRGGSQTHPYYMGTHPNQKRHGLPEIVRALKSFSSRRINQLRKPPVSPCGSATITNILSATTANSTRYTHTSRITP